jgi:hypothetical protein
LVDPYRGSICQTYCVTSNQEHTFAILLVGFGWFRSETFYSMFSSDLLWGLTKEFDDTGFWSRDLRQTSLYTIVLGLDLTLKLGSELQLGEFTMVSQPIRLILVDWLYTKEFLFRVRLFQVR